MFEILEKETKKMVKKNDKGETFTVTSGDIAIFHRDKWGVVIEEGSYIEHPKKGRTSHITTLHSIPFGKKDREVRDFLKKGYMYVGKSETPHEA